MVIKGAFSLIVIVIVAMVVMVFLKWFFRKPKKGGKKW